MTTFELITTAIALAMDAFAVAICKGLATERAKLKHMAITGLWFGGFQALMPLIGYLIGSSFAGYIQSFDHWIAFGLLALIGANMLKEAIFRDGEQCECGCESTDASFGFKVMLIMALATSIDALAVGVGYAMIPDLDIVVAIASIGIITFLLSAIGIKIGNVFGAKYKHFAEAAGGAVLIIMGTKILIEHLFFG